MEPVVHQYVNYLTVDCKYPLLVSLYLKIGRHQKRLSLTQLPAEK